MHGSWRPGTDNTTEQRVTCAVHFACRVLFMCLFVWVCVECASVVCMSMACPHVAHRCRVTFRRFSRETRICL